MIRVLLAQEGEMLGHLLDLETQAVGSESERSTLIRLQGTDSKSDLKGGGGPEPPRREADGE